MALRNARQIENEILDLCLLFLDHFHGQSCMHLVLGALDTHDTSFYLLWISVIANENNIVISEYKMRDT